MTTPPRKDWGAPPPEVPRKEPEEAPGFFDRPKVIRVVIYAVFLISAVLVALDLLIDKHAHFHFEDLFGFYGFYGFLAFVFIVLAAKVLRVFVMRSEDYYDR